MAAHTIYGIKKWSCLSKTVPSVQQIKHIHLYDFDNTLFMSPLPNPKLWTGATIGSLQTEDCFANGGWWHDEHILEATGGGLAKEEPRAWEGWWNEQIVQLVELSMKQKDALTILLTGRGQHKFASIIKRMITAKKLEFDLVCLKPKVGPQGQRFASTMNFKQNLLEELVYTYKEAEELKIYEDRPKHVKGFKEFFVKMNNAISMGVSPVTRKSLRADVIHVPDFSTSLDPVTETAEVQRMINSHNITVHNNSEIHVRPIRYAIKKSVFFTGYLLPQAATSTLLPLIQTASANIPEADLKILANNVMICPRPATQAILEKAGGLGSKRIWSINGVGVYNNSVIAARVVPMASSGDVYTESATPFIVLACRKNAKPADATHIQNWQPVPGDQQFVFETTVGEKAQLRIEREGSNDGDTDGNHAKDRGLGPNRPRGRDDDDRRPHNDDHRRGRYRGGNHNRGGDRGGPGGHRNGPYPPRGGRGQGRGGGGGPRGGKGRGGYKSLDDIGGGGSGPGGSGYDAAYPPLSGRSAPVAYDESLMY